MYQATLDHLVIQEKQAIQELLGILVTQVHQAIQVIQVFQE